MAIFDALKGRSEADRKWVVDFVLPPVAKQHRKLEQDTSNLEAEWYPHEGDPQALLKAISFYLGAMNRHPLKIKVREELLDFIGQKASRVINQLYSKFQHDNGVPELENRRESLSMATEIVEKLLVSYLRLHRDYFSLNEREFQKSQQALVSVAVRILEWVFLLQRIAALRYQKLPGKYLKLSSQLFFAHSSSLFIREPLPLVGSLWGWLRGFGGARIHYQQGRQTASLEELYIAIQLFGVMDVITWPCHQSYVLDAYLSLLPQPLRVTHTEQGNPSDKTLYLEKESEYFAGFRNRGDATLVLDLNRLHSSLQRELGLLQRGQTPSELFLKLDEPDRQPLIELMLSKLGYRQRQDERFQLNANVGLSLYCGFMECFSLIHDIEKNEGKGGSTLRDALAKNSSIIKGKGGKQSSWFVVDESLGGIQLRINENPYIHPLYVGQLVAYTLHLGEFREPPQLGYIYRLFRPKDGVLEVTVIKLSRTAESIALQSPRMKKDQHASPAILVRSNKGERWQVVLPQRHPFKKGDNVYLRRHKKSYPLVFPKPAVVQREFNIYTIKGGES